MKKLLILVPILFVLFISCEDNIFGGSEVVRGSIEFMDLQTGKMEPAAGAKIEIKEDDDNNDAILTLVSEDGSFAIDFLRPVEYIMEVSFEKMIDSVQSPVKYSITRHFDASQESDFDVILTRDNDQTILQVRVLDAVDAPVPGASVCLFNNESIRSENSPGCAGSIIVTSTSTSGYAVFTDLNAQQYYLNVQAQLGSAELNNSFDGSITSATVTLNTLNEVSITTAIQPPAPSITPPALSITVIDSLGIEIQGAEVCLYKNEGIRNANAPQCGGSIIQSITNSEGHVVFDNLDTSVYYYNSRAILGNITLDSLATISIDSVLKADEVREISIQLFNGSN